MKLCTKFEFECLGSKAPYPAACYISSSRPDFSSISISFYVRNWLQLLCFSRKSLSSDWVLSYWSRTRRTNLFYKAAVWCTNETAILWPCCEGLFINAEMHKVTLWHCNAERIRRIFLQAPVVEAIMIKPEKVHARTFELLIRSVWLSYHIACKSTCGS